MAKKSQKNRQDKLLKRRRKAKERAKNQQQFQRLTLPQAVIRKAREYPISECWINPGWENGNGGLITVMVARQQPNELITWASYLLDVYCLGLKDTMTNANFPHSALQSEILPGLYPYDVPVKCTPELAHQMVYQAIDYAAQFDFKPQKDFKLSRLVLEERGALEEPYQLTFGKDGKPLFIAGPYDNARAIVAKLERNPGPGNYDYLVNVGSMFDEDDFYEDDFDEDDADSER